MTLAEIKEAVRAGRIVNWAHGGYCVERHVSADGEERWLIVCQLNGSAIGLTWNDGVTLNGRESEFMLGEEGGSL